MKILALDSSGMTASVAVLEDDILTAEFSITHKKTHSQTLLPMIEQVKSMTELKLEELDAVAVSAGPGSFTGLRIGSGTAKGLAQALDIPVIPVPSLEALAYQLYGCEALICPVMDARRGQVYTGLYSFEAEEFHADDSSCLERVYHFKKHLEQCAISVEEIAQKCNEFKREIVFLGDGVPVSKKKLDELLEVPYSIAPAHRRLQSAAAAAVYGKYLFEQGSCEAAWEHSPIYLRLSQAERERLEREKA